MGNIRIDQSVIELIVLANPNVRVCQSVVEFITLEAPPVIACGNPPNGTIGQPYSHTFPVTSGAPPFTFSIIAGSLPPGLTLNASTGVVSGIPTAGVFFPFTIHVVDINLNGSSVDCSITIAVPTKITLRGVKRSPRCEPVSDLVAEIEPPEHVDRAV